jgi:acyl carrier protein
MQEFYKKLSDILEVDNIKDLDVLRDFEYWDSLTVLSILAMLDSELSISLSIEELDACITARDLYVMVEGKK